MKTQITQSNYTIKNLLSEGMSNAKTSKNSEKTFILYMAPYTQNKYKANLCPKATEGCSAACLFSAGRGRFDSVKNARINKANYFLEERYNFLQQLAAEILKQYAKAKRLGYRVNFRLNGTTDINFFYLLQKYASLDVESLQDAATFYDYTKVLSYIKQHGHKANVWYTFSRSEHNNTECRAALEMGANVSLVYKGTMPSHIWGSALYDGDASDDAMIGRQSTIFALKAKGEAKHDATGFVIDLTDL